MCLMDTYAPTFPPSGQAGRHACMRVLIGILWYLFLCLFVAMYPNKTVPILKNQGFPHDFLICWVPWWGGFGRGVLSWQWNFFILCCLAVSIYPFPELRHLLQQMIQSWWKTARSKWNEFLIIYYSLYKQMPSQIVGHT